MSNRTRSNTLFASDLTGMRIFQEKKRTVYYDIFNRNGYIITNAETRKYVGWSARYSAMGLIGCLVYYLSRNLVAGVIVGLAGVIILEYLFRKLFLHKLPEIKGYKPAKKPGYIDETAQGESYFKIILLIIAGILMMLMMGMNIKSQKMDTITLVLSYVVMYGSAFLAVMNAIALYRKIRDR